MRPALLAIVVLGCQHHAMPPPAGPDQSVHDAMILVCAAPERAKRDHAATKADAIAGHLTDGVGNPDVLAAAEAWKTDGIDRKQLNALVQQAKLSRCALRDEAQ